MTVITKTKIVKALKTTGKGLNVSGKVYGQYVKASYCAATGLPVDIVDFKLRSTGFAFNYYWTKGMREFYFQINKLPKLKNFLAIK